MGMMLIQHKMTKGHRLTFWILLCKALVVCGGKMSYLRRPFDSPHYEQSAHGGLNNGFRGQYVTGSRGMEVIPPMHHPNSNEILLEPTCEELKAMWRNYKRQSRAEITNEISTFEPKLFWNYDPPTRPMHLQSFGSLGGRTKARFRLRNPKQTLYGQMMYKPSKNKSKIRPFDKLRMEAAANKEESKETSSPGSDGQVGVISENLKSPIVHLHPPAEPTKISSLQKLKNLLREEQGGSRKSSNAQVDDSPKYGKIILSPPQGQDGRIANKPKELMTPFEKIRFGHANKLLEENSRRYRTLYKRAPPPEFHSYTYPFMVSGDKGFQRLQELPQELMFPQNFPLNLRQQSTQPVGMSYNGENDDVRLENLQDSQYIGSSWHPLLHFMYTHSSSPASKQDSFEYCGEKEEQPCLIDADCSCVGFFPLKCHLNTCQPYNFQHEAEAEDGLQSEEYDNHFESQLEPITKRRDVTPSEMKRNQSHQLGN